MIPFKGWDTFVGSRDISDEEWELLADCAHTRVDHGYGVRSGGAPGSDDAAHVGALRSVIFQRGVAEHERIAIYLPWNGFKRKWKGVETRLFHNPERGIYDTQHVPNREEAEAISLAARGTWAGLEQGGINLHIRNAYQPLGTHLDLPSKALVCCADPAGKRGGVRGGTNTAVRIALDAGIRVLNIRRDEDRRSIERFIQEHKKLT